MRERLEKLHGHRVKFEARIETFGVRQSRRGTRATLLLVDLRRSEPYEFLADHVWVQGGDWTQGLDLGDCIEFEARVVSYEKKRSGQVKIDYRLDRPARAVLKEKNNKAA